MKSCTITYKVGLKKENQPIDCGLQTLRSPRRLMFEQFPSPLYLSLSLFRQCRCYFRITRLQSTITVLIIGIFLKGNRRIFAINNQRILPLRFEFGIITIERPVTACYSLFLLFDSPAHVDSMGNAN